MRRRGSKDHNHDELQGRFEALGCTVVDLSTAGVDDLPDVAVGCVGRTHLVEFKNPATAYGKRGMTAGQRAFAGRWRGGAIVTVWTVDEVTALVQNWRRP